LQRKEKQKPAHYGWREAIIESALRREKEGKKKEEKKKRKKEREEQEENGKGRAFTQNRGHTKYGRRQTKQKEFKRKPFLLRAKRR